MPIDQALNTPGLQDSGANALGLANSQTLLWKYMATIGMYSAVVIGLLIGFLWLLKTQPAFTARLKTLFGLKTPPPPPQPKLHVEEEMYVEEGKKLLIIGCDGERFLVSSSAEGIQFLTKLNQDHPMMPPVYVEPEDPEAQTWEDHAGIRGRAINPTESGVSHPAPPAFKGLQPAFMNAVKELIPKAESSPGTPQSPFGPQR